MTVFFLLHIILCIWTWWSDHTGYTLWAEAFLWSSGASLCPCGLKQSTLTEIHIVGTASCRTTPLKKKTDADSDCRRRTAVCCDLEEEQCQGDLLFASVFTNARVFPVNSCWSVRVWVCMCVCDGGREFSVPRPPLPLFLTHYPSIFLSHCVQSVFTWWWRWRWRGRSLPQQGSGYTEQL